jgi:DNA (cytosine-5)-methyltransferase 1
VAGKRAGLEGARSGLFYELIRAWDETQAPYILWENVDGARSSNNGEDFAAVLSAIVGAAIAVPEDGWQPAGVAAGATGVAAWRVLDLQHFGPPQRRRRVFIVGARAGGVDPAEILAVSESVCGHLAPRERQRQGAAGRAAGGAGAIGWDDEFNAADEMIGTIVRTPVNGGSRQRAGVLAFKSGQSEAAGGTFVTEGFTPTLQGGSNGSTQVLAVLAFEPRYYTRDNKTGGAPSDVVKVDASIGKNGDAVPHVLCTTGPVTHALPAEGCDASEDGTGRGTPVVVGTLDFGGHGGSYNGQDVYQNRLPVSNGRPRRLMPLECERLMGWPDRWTAEGIREDGTAYAMSDTARYRLCGNGVGTPCAAWIGRRLVWAETHTLDAAPRRTETR